MSIHTEELFQIPLSLYVIWPRLQSSGKCGTIRLITAAPNYRGRLKNTARK